MKGKCACNDGYTEMVGIFQPDRDRDRHRCSHRERGSEWERKRERKS
jgi:hypothetical protein